jgi:hypothetical protein
MSAHHRPPLQVKPTPLPTAIDDWERKIKHGLTLNDHVEAVHLMLWEENPEYRAFLEAVWDSDAVEGSLSIDSTMAAQILREKAKAIDGNPAARKNLDTLKKSLGVVLNRYGNSRKERRHTVHGQVVPTDNGTE